MSTVSLTILTFAGCLGWILFFATLLRLLDVSKSRTIRVPLTIPFVVVPLSTTVVTGREGYDAQEERTSVQ